MELHPDSGLGSLKISRLTWKINDLFSTRNWNLFFSIITNWVSWNFGDSSEWSDTSDIKYLNISCWFFFFYCMFSFIHRYKWFKELWDVLMLPELDAIVLTSQSMCFPLVSLILFLFGTCTAYWVGLLSSTSVRLLSSLWLALKR